ncbi:MAG TPA: O-antigen ligase family protein [Opitutaceae bacterium]|nr:O-antigen ligase family protein [Opitutaceae bacterium]
MNAIPRTLALIGLVGLAAVTLAHPSATRMQTWPWALMTAALWIIPVVLLAIVVAREKILRLPNAFVGAGLVLLAMAAVVSAGASPMSAASLPLTWPTLGGVALCLLLHHWLAVDEVAATSRTRQICTGIAAAGALVVSASLLAWLADAAPALTSRNTYPFGHSTYTGGFVVLVLPWLVERAWTARAGRRAGWCAATLASLLVLASTSSRGAVAGLGFAGVVCVVAALFSAAWTLRQKAILVAAVIVLGLAAIGANPRLRELVLHRSWGESARESNRQRSAMVDAGMRLGQEHPLLGIGPGTVPLAYPSVRTLLEGGVDNVLQLHNAPVQLWATLGATGVLALLLVIGGTSAALRAAGPRAPILAATASLAGYGIFSLTDHQFDLPIIAAAIAANLAIVTAAVPRRTWPFSRGNRSALLAAIALLVAAPAFALLRDLGARHAYEQALIALETQNLPAALAALDRATARAPYDPYFQHQAAGALLRARENETIPARRIELTRAAAQRLEASLACGVHLEFAHFNLGWLQLELGAPAAAARHFKAAAHLVPDKGGVYFGLGLAWLDLGQRDAAIRAFALEWINDPRQLTSPAWEVPTLTALRPDVRAETLRLYAGLRTAHPSTVQAEAWTRWWLGAPIPPTDLAPAFTGEASQLAAALPAIQSGAPLPAFSPTEPAWARLLAAWRNTGTPGTYTKLVPHDPALAAALAQRAARHRENFQDFLTAPTEEEAALMRTSRRERPGYGVLARHPDGPILADIYVVQENRVVADFATGLFPPKGWLPGRFLLALLPRDPR